MALVELSLAEAEAALAGHEDRLGVAVSNSPRATVLSGEPGALAEVLAGLEARGVFCRPVKVDVASHSPQVEPLRAELVAALAELRPQGVAVPMLSTVMGALVGGPELGAGYWADNLRQPVRFAGAVQALVESGHGLFVELSPHPLLTTSVEEVLHGAEGEGCAVGSLRRGQGERASLLEALGGLWVRGRPPAWERLFPAGGRRVPLPTYPWQRQRHWIEAPACAEEEEDAAWEDEVDEGDAAGPGPTLSGPARDLLDRLAAAGPGARPALLEEILRAQVAQVLRLAEDEIDGAAPLPSLGMDSLMGMELRNRFEALLGVRVPATVMWQSMAAQVAFLATHEGLRPAGAR
jgi:acyl transferase domain-containing protein